MAKLTIFIAIFSAQREKRYSEYFHAASLSSFKQIPAHNESCPTTAIGWVWAATCWLLLSVALLHFACNPAALSAPAANRLYFCQPVGAAGTPLGRIPIALAVVNVGEQSKSNLLGGIHA